MHKDFYRLQTDPFGTHPNTGTFFISHTHKEAWYYLLFGIDTQEPFLVLTGEYGMGKTLLCLRLVKLLKEKGTPRVEYIPTTSEGFGGILRRMATSLGISPVPEDEEILQDMIYERFRADDEKSRFYLIIDDAHELDTAILTKLKYLSTFSHNEFFPVVMIFVGHPSFLQDLRTPALSSLNQRIKRRYHLARFSLEDTKNYIYFRLLKSGAAGVPAFPKETIEKIFAYSGGVPRLINNICDTCLLIGASKQLTSIPPAIVDDARKLVEGSLTGTKAESRPDLASQDSGAVIPLPFSEDLPAGDAPKQDASASTRLEPGEPRPETAVKPLVSSFPRKLKFAVTAAVAVALLIVGYAALSQYFMKDSGLFTLVFPPTSPVPQNAPVLHPKKAAPLAEGAVEIPILREEMTEKPSGETTVQTARTEPAMSAPAAVSPKQAGGSETRKSSGMETAAPGGTEPPALHPYSLRASSYQQEDRALKELSEIRQLGLTPYLVKADLGDMGTLWRVYIGFYATEAEARKVKSGHSKLAGATVQKTDFACQVGEFSNETDSLNMFKRLRQAGYFPYAIQLERNRFRLFLGAYEKKTEAEDLQRELQKKGIQSQVVRR